MGRQRLSARHQRRGHPAAGRIFAVVDEWDALSSDRPYRPAWPASQVREYLRAQSGHHFDPAMVGPFLDFATREAS